MSLGFSPSYRPLTTPGGTLDHGVDYEVSGMAKSFVDGATDYTDDPFGFMGMLISPRDVVSLKQDGQDRRGSLSLWFRDDLSSVVYLIDETNNTFVVNEDAVENFKLVMVDIEPGTTFVGVNKTEFTIGESSTVMHASQRRPLSIIRHSAFMWQTETDEFVCKSDTEISWS